MQAAGRTVEIDPAEATDLTTFGDLLAAGGKPAADAGVGRAPEDRVELADDTVATAFLYQLEVEMAALTGADPLRLTGDPDESEGFAEEVADLGRQLGNGVGRLAAGGGATGASISDSWRAPRQTSVARSRPIRPLPGHRPYAL